jgi:secreted trypsin-like serine protease
MSPSDCELMYQDTSKITDTMMCASGSASNNLFGLLSGSYADACYGDSGGPFTVRQHGREVLEGVISWGRFDE